jgi:hypothetical protein
MGLRRRLKIHFIRLGKPVKNCYRESLTGTFRNEWINDDWFIGLDDTQPRSKRGGASTTRARPHSSLGGLPQGALMNYWTRSPSGRAFEVRSELAHCPM